MPTYKTKALDSKTWPDFARLVEANNGVWGGCWCMWYHGKDESAAKSPALKRKAKECRVREGCAHAALVYEGKDCVGWCQFGSPEEIPRIRNEKTYLETDPKLPDWRITCFFSGKGHRGNGVASATLKGAIAQIKKLGRDRATGYRFTLVRKYPSAVMARDCGPSSWVLHALRNVTWAARTWRAVTCLEFEVGGSATPHPIANLAPTLPID